MRHVLGQHCDEMAAADNQCLVQRSSRRAVAIHRSAIVFAWAARTGGAQHVDTFAGGHGVEDAGELAVVGICCVSEGKTCSMPQARCSDTRTSMTWPYWLIDRYR